jgi:hypothetical protein
MGTLGRPLDEALAALSALWLPQGQGGLGEAEALLVPLGEAAGIGGVMGHYRQCLAACLDLLACPTAPEGERKRYAANARFALVHQLGAALRPRRHPGLVTGQAGPEARQLARGDAEGRIDGRPLVVWIHHAPDQPAVAWLRDPAKVGRDRACWYRRP